MSPPQKKDSVPGTSRWDGIRGTGRLAAYRTGKAAVSDKWGPEVHVMGYKKGKAGAFPIWKRACLKRYLKNLSIYPCTKTKNTMNGRTYLTYRRSPFGNMRPLPVSASAMKLSHPQPRL